jgi:hypothetical protein
VESGPLVRSSYHARDQVPDAEARRAARAWSAANPGVASVTGGPRIDSEGRVIYRAGG